MILGDSSQRGEKNEKGCGVGENLRMLGRTQSSTIFRNGPLVYSVF